MTSIRILFFLLGFSLLALTASSCKGTKGVVSTPAGEDKISGMSLDLLNSGLQGAQINEPWMQGKARVAANLNGDQYNVTATINMQRDESIFVSVRKLGFELARLIVSTDTIIAINRLERNYMLYSMKEFGEFIGFPVNLNLLQEMLLGNPYLGDQPKWKQGNKPSLALLSSNSEGLEAVSSILLPDFKMEASIIKDTKKDRSLHSKFSNYQAIKDNKYFSYIRSYELNAEQDEALSVEIQFTSIEWDKPFKLDKDIPARYSRVYN